MLAAITSYPERIKAGKKKEKIILDTLRLRGMVIEDPTAKEDQEDKIDGWIIKDGKRYALQVKFRENGDDIIFEVLKDVKRNILGRDSVSQAHYYLVVDRHGNARMFLVASIKNIVQQILPLARGLYSTNQTRWKGKGWELKITLDKANGNTKLMAYFDPSMFRCFGEWHINL
jgi:hypothetical protein